MVPFQLEILALVAVLIGIIVNTYIVVIVFLTKQITFASKVLLLHLGLVNAVLCLFYVIFYTISLSRLLPMALDAMDVTCLLFGLCFNTLHSIALWTLCALNFDRYFAIATPLHYGTFINTKKVLITLGAGWIVSTLFSLPQAVRISAYKFDSDYELCLPNLQTTESLIYSISFVLFTILLPIILILGCNMKVLMIARYQRNRIASAILEVTLSAQLTITHQRNPFFVPGAARGAGSGAGAEPEEAAGGGLAVNCKACTQASNQNNPASSVIQLVGSAILFHCPYYFVILWHSVLPFVASGWRTPATLLNLASFLLLLSPTINAILYGVRSKIVRRSFRNIWRRQKQKIEIHYEIQARTPSTCGSRRPSLSGTQFQQQQQPLLFAFAVAETGRSDARSEVGIEPDGPLEAGSPLGRVKFGSCSTLTGLGCPPTPTPTLTAPHAPPPPPPPLPPPGPAPSHGSAHEHTRRPKITITKIMTDEADDGKPRPGTPRTPLSPLSPPLPDVLATTAATEHLHQHHHQLQQRHQHHHQHPHPKHLHHCSLRSPTATVGGGSSTTITTPPNSTTDNLNVAGQSEPGRPCSSPAGAACVEPKTLFRKFSSLQEMLDNGTE